MTGLRWSAEDAGIRFSVEDASGPLPVERWALANDLKTPTASRGHVGHLLQWLADDRAWQTEREVFVPSAVIADASPMTLQALGLPPQAPYMIELTKDGLWTDRTFTVRWRLLASGGRPILGATRQGAVLTVGSRRYTLLNPLFAVIQAVEELNAASDRESRLAALSLLQECLPADAAVDSLLKETRVARADAFTLNAYRDERGELQIDPIALRRAGRSRDALVDTEEEPREVLPAARQDDWARHFRRLGSRSILPAGQGWFLTASPALQRALAVVRDVQQASAAERMAFVRNPRPRLQSVLSAEISEEELEQLFAETGRYGERVRDVGLWQPKVLPIIKGPQQSWLPPEQMGLRVGDVTVPIEPARAPALVEALVAAKAVGQTEISFDGHRIPVTEESIQAARTLAAEATRSGQEAGKDKPSDPGPVAVLIVDNIEEASFVRTRRETKGEPGDTPNCLRTELFDFQLQGYRWLQELWCAGATGGVLADDMGLGKTVQTLSFLAWVRRHAANNDRRPILIVGPTGLLRNWRAEHDRHLTPPGLGDMIEAHGSGLHALRISAGGRAAELSTGLPSLDLEALQRADWVLTTYETLRDYQHSFLKVSWLVVVFDEAQRIKNPAVMTTDAAKALQGEFTLALTGTPVENHLGDLWSIADTVQPGCLGSLKSFVGTYDSTGSDSAKLEALKHRVQVDNPPPLMLRRLKQDHLHGLPRISFHVERVAMPAVQATQYDRVIDAARDKKGASQSAMLEALQNLRAVSLHPYETQTSGDDEFIAASARLAHTIRVLDGIRDRGEKALVFVEALAMQAALTALLQRRYRLPQPPIVINGSVAGQSRKDRVDRFQDRAGFDVMLLSPRAGGVGLTITAANHVIHLSRWWNPAVEDQATDRVYRIGQHRDVHVYVPLAIHPRHGDGSFDALLGALLDRKRTLSRGVLAPAGAGDNDLRDLYTASVEAHSGACDSASALRHGPD